MAALAYWILQKMLVANEGDNSLMARAIGKDFKGTMSVIAYMISVPLSFYNQWIAQVIFVLIALVWLVPDRRIEEVLSRAHG
jgi:uncharacterized membrane protein